MESIGAVAAAVANTIEYIVLALNLISLAFAYQTRWQGVIKYIVS